MIDKKKLKQEFLDLVQPKGVFIFRNETTGRVYLGSSLNLKNKETRIKLMLKTGNHFINTLQEDWNKFGDEAFTYEEAETLQLKDDPNYDYNEDLEILEMLWIDKFRPLAEKCYNKNEKIRLI